MNRQQLITAEQFAEQKFDLPEGGRWHELNEGEIVTLQPPEALHGTVVLNLTRAIGDWVQRVNGGARGYACFEIGLIVRRDPDTVLSPAISWFESSERFEEADKAVTGVCPRMVVEVASTNDRRRGMAERVAAYHTCGVDMVWVVDPIEKEVNVAPQRKPTRVVTRRCSLSGSPVLTGFSLFVESLFAEPKWWTS